LDQENFGEKRQYFCFKFFLPRNDFLKIFDVFWGGSFAATKLKNALQKKTWPLSVSTKFKTEENFDPCNDNHFE